MKNFTLEFTNHEWNLYTEDKTKVGTEVLKLFPDLKDLSYLEDEYTSIVATWDSTEKVGYIDVEITAVHSDSTYPFNYKFNDFNKFVEALNNLENEIEIDKLNVNDWEYEKEDPYGSRGLSIKDFI
ncbi:hypothetical protein ABVN59_05205 [Fusobacterium vincentii]|uniref:hypothetical protein n=1 Tax=Fusobacterium TaxID=848 RepID=UPI0003B90AD5|nr:hypothetical protein [Fusobacterium nucleatum]ERT44816.1 hypothetical protein HMPREF1768_01763 [Fusobacterium nucleatum CTI-7]